MATDELDEQQDLLYKTRSLEAQEVIGRIPSRIVRYGVSIIGLILLVIVIASGFIHYPDAITVTASIVNTEYPKTIMLASSSSIEELRVFDGELTSTGQIIAVLKSNERIDDVFFIKRQAEKIDTAINIDQVLFEPPGKSLILGKLKPFYTGLSIAVADYRGASAKTENAMYERACRVRERARQLLNAIENWETNVIIRSPQAGRISFLMPLDGSYVIPANIPIMTVVPKNISKPIILAKISGNVNSKLNVGLPVVLKIDSYPSERFGTLAGIVSNVMTVDSETLLSIRPTNQMITSNGFKVPARSLLYATASITTNNKTLLQHLFEKLRP